MGAPDRRPRFRAAVYAPREGMKNSCRVVLLLMAESMNSKGVVSVPRTKLADELGVHPSRITEAITLARKLGFLGTVKRGRPGVTAVYQGQIPGPMVRSDAPPSMVRKPGGDMVRPDAPLSGPTWCGRQVSQVGNAGRESEGSASVAPADGVSNEKAAPQPVGSGVTVCEWHPWQPCPDDCRNFERMSA